MTNHLGNGTPSPALAPSPNPPSANPAIILVGDFFARLKHNLSPHVPKLFAATISIVFLGLILPFLFSFARFANKDSESLPFVQTVQVSMRISGFDGTLALENWPQLKKQPEGMFGHQFESNSPHPPNTAGVGRR